MPRDIRFKRENLLTLNLLPGLNEVSLYKINYYLAPIVDELEFLWDGITLNHTYESQGGKYIRATLILISYDVSAARKYVDMFQHLYHAISMRKRQITRIGNIILLE